jgi:hypothetical protein
LSLGFDHFGTLADLSVTLQELSVLQLTFPLCQETVFMMNIADQCTAKKNISHSQPGAGSCEN